MKFVISNTPTKAALVTPLDEKANKILRIIENRWKGNNTVTPNLQVVATDKYKSILFSMYGSNYADAFHSNSRNIINDLVMFVFKNYPGDTFFFKVEP